MKEKQIDALYKRQSEAYAQSFDKQRDELVFGQGNLNARLLLIGEAPGGEEVKQKKPFVGAAGKNLNHFLELIGLQREDLYITNVVKFRPYRINPKTQRAVNRPPSKKEIDLSTPFLQEEIQIIQPKIIVTLGNVPLKAVVGQKYTIGDLHGKMQQVQQQDVFPLYHPASIIYNQSLKEVYEQDVKSLRNYVIS